MTRAAIALYEHVYEDLLADVPGLPGKVMARAEHHPLRVAAAFAAIDGGSAMEPGVLRMEHLLAGLEATRYAGDSVNLIFGGHVENPTAAKILAHVREALDGLTRSELHKKLGNNAKKETLDAAVEYLVKHRLCVEEDVRSGGPGAPRKVVRIDPQNADRSIPLARPWAVAMDKARVFAASCTEDDREPVDGPGRRPDGTTT